MPEQKSKNTGSVLPWKTAPVRGCGAGLPLPGSSLASSLSDREEARHPQRLPPPPLLPPRAPRRLSFVLLPLPEPFLLLRTTLSWSFSGWRALQ